MTVEIKIKTFRLLDYSETVFENLESRNFFLKIV